MSRNIRYDSPRSAGVENFLIRCKHMAHFKWTPAQQLKFESASGGYPFYAPIAFVLD